MDDSQSTFTWPLSSIELIDHFFLTTWRPLDHTYTLFFFYLPGLAFPVFECAGTQSSAFPRHSAIAMGLNLIYILIISKLLSLVLTSTLSFSNCQLDLTSWMSNSCFKWTWQNQNLDSFPHTHPCPAFSMSPLVHAWLLKGIKRDVKTFHGSSCVNVLKLLFHC